MMRLSRSASDILHFDPEIELTLCASHREQRQRVLNQQNLNIMAELERQTLGDFAMPYIAGNFRGIVTPSIANNNFEIKPSIIHIVKNNQFGGL